MTNLNGMLDRFARRLLLALLMSLYVALSVPTTSFSQSALPDEVQADILRAKIVKMAKGDGKGHQDFAGILSSIDEYKKLDVEVPPVILLVEAKAAHASSDSMRAIRAIESYMIVADHKSPEYQQAVELYPEYQAAAEPARQMQRDKLKTQPLDCKDPKGEDKNGYSDANFYLYPKTIRLTSPLEGARSTLTVTWTVRRTPYHNPIYIDSLTAQVSLVAKIPFVRDDMIPLTTITSGGDKRSLALDEEASFTSVGSTRNPAAGKYCLVFEGRDPGEAFYAYKVFPDPLVILP